MPRPGHGAWFHQRLFPFVGRGRHPELIGMECLRTTRVRYMSVIGRQQVLLSEHMFEQRMQSRMKQYVPEDFPLVDQELDELLLVREQIVDALLHLRLELFQYSCPQRVRLLVAQRIFKQAIAVFVQVLFRQLEIGGCFGKLAGHWDFLCGRGRESRQSFDDVPEAASKEAVDRRARPGGRCPSIVRASLRSSRNGDGATARLPRHDHGVQPVALRDDRCCRQLGQPFGAAHRRRFAFRAG